MLDIVRSHQDVASAAPLESGKVTLAQLRALVAVVDEGSFTAAARTLRTTQSAVSHALHALEEALGSAVLVSRSGAKTTILGDDILADARIALAAVMRLRQRAASAAGLTAGHVKLASVDSAAVRFLPALIRAFHLNYPQLTISLFRGTDAEVTTWVRDGLADVGIMAAIDDSALCVEPFIEDPMVLVVARGHKFAGCAAVQATNLSSEPFLMSGAGCETTIRSFFAMSDIEPRVVAKVFDTPTLLTMTRDHAGITIVPRSVLPDPMIDLREVPLSPLHVRRLVLSRRHDRQLTPAAAALFDTLLHVRTSPLRALQTG